MDGPRFDSFARSFAARLSRRAALSLGGAAAAATVLAATGLGSTSAATTTRYAVIRRYKLATGTSLTNLATLLRTGYVPQLQAFPGFLGYRVVDTGNGGLTTITAFQTKQQEATAAQQLVPWVQQHLAGLLPAPSQIESGDVLVNAEVCPVPVTPTVTATTAAPTATATTPPPTQAPCTGQGCACSTGTENPCDPGLICCPQKPGTPGGPGICQPNSQCVCSVPGEPGVGCPCITGTQNPCGVETLVCCQSTNRPGGPGTCVRAAVGCQPVGPTAVPTSPPAACTLGDNSTCPGGQECCPVHGQEGGTICIPTGTNCAQQACAGDGASCIYASECCTSGASCSGGVCTAAAACPGGEGCACTTGTENPCDSGLNCCSAPGAAPGGPGVCQSASC